MRWSFLLPVIGAILQILFISVWVYDWMNGNPMVRSRTMILPLNILTFLSCIIVFWLAVDEE